MVRSPNSATSSKSSIIIALALAIAGLYFGRPIFIPLALALVFSFLLSPAVDLLQRVRLGRVPAVLVVLAFGLALVAGVAWEVGNQLVEITSHIGDYKANLVRTVRSLRPGTNGPLGQATATVKELNKELAAAPGQPANTPNEAGGRRPLPVQLTSPPTNLFDDLRALLGPLTGAAETAAMVIIFAAFILMRREDLRNRLLRLGGQGRLTLMTKALDDASQRLSRYLLLQLLVNACYGILFGIGLYFIGLPNALLWGTLAALLRLIPYIGTLIATAFPAAMALAIFPGWRHALMIFGLYVVLDLITTNVVEPWLYGAQTGMSSLAILVAAIFWSVLWGPIGLILSTPLTVCLLLLGRYVPQLSFLEVMLGDEPALRPEEVFYQRLLAMDQEEARNIIELQLRDKSPEDLYQTVFIPALRLAEEDRHMDAVGERTSEFIYQTSRELIDDLGERMVAHGSAQDADGKNVLPERRSGRRQIICIPARDEADELVAMMLSHVIQQASYRAAHLAIGTVDDMLKQVEQSGSQIVCVSALPPFAVGQARALCRRLRSRFPQLGIILGLWDFAGGPLKAQERVGANCANAVATTLSEGLLQVRRLAGIDPAELPKLKVLAGADDATETAQSKV